MILWGVAAAQELVDDDVIEVVVTASRGSEEPDHPVAVEVVDRATIEASGAESLAEVLQERPGLQVDRTNTGTAIRIQGMEAEHTLILIDGQRVLGRKDGVIDLDRLPLSNIERIEIVKGPSSSLYGSDAMGGVINLITRKPQKGEVGAHLRLGTGLRVDGDVDASVKLGALRARIAAGWHSREAWDRRPETPSTDASALEQGNIDLRLTNDPEARTRVTVDGGYQQRNLEGIDSNLAGAVLDRLQVVEDARAAIELKHEVTDATHLEAKVSTGFYKDQFLNDQRGGKALDIASVTEEANAEASTILHTRWNEHHVSLGIDGLYQRLETDRLETGKANRTRGGAFAQGTISWRTRGPHLRFSPGVRLDVDTQFGSAVTPRLAMSATFDDRFVIRGGGGMGYRAPDFRELYLLFENPGVGYVVSGDPDLQPERSVNANLGFEWTVSDDVSVNAYGFSNWIRNLINIGTVDLEPGAIQRFGYENVSRAWTTGGELGLALTPGPLDFGANLSLTHAWDLDLDRQLANRVPVRVTGWLGVKPIDRVLLRAQAGFSGPSVTYITVADQEEARTNPSTLTLDARGAWTVYDGVKVFVGADNLLNTKGPETAPLAPRMAYAGFTFRGAMQ